MAFFVGSCLFLPGQLNTHAPQPVQSSTATCTVNFLPARSALPSADLKFLGAFLSSLSSYALMRMAPCGHTSEQKPHWIHASLSQQGTCKAMLRFSYCVVPVGNTPPSGILLVGNSSPRPAIISPNTSCTKAGAVAGTGALVCSLEETCAGYFTSCRPANAASTAL